MQSGSYVAASNSFSIPTCDCLSFILINLKLPTCTTIPNLGPSPLLHLGPASTSVLAPGRESPMEPSVMKLAVLALALAAAAASRLPPTEDVILDKNSLADFPRTNVDQDSLSPVSFDDYVNIFNDSPNNDFQLPSNSGGVPGLGFPFGDTTGAGSAWVPAPAPASGEVAGRAPARAIGASPSETPAAKPP